MEYLTSQLKERYSTKILHTFNKLRLWNIVEDNVSDAHYRDMMLTRLENSGITIEEFEIPEGNEKEFKLSRKVDPYKVLYKTVRDELIERKILVYDNNKLRTVEELRELRNTIIARKATKEDKESKQIGNFRDLFIISNSVYVSEMIELYCKSENILPENKHTIDMSIISQLLIAKYIPQLNPAECYLDIEKSVYVKYENVQKQLKQDKLSRLYKPREYACIEFSKIRDFTSKSRYDQFMNTLVGFHFISRITDLLGLKNGYDQETPITYDKIMVVRTFMMNHLVMIKNIFNLKKTKSKDIKEFRATTLFINSVFESWNLLKFVCVYKNNHSKGSETNIYPIKDH